MGFFQLNTPENARSQAFRYGDEPQNLAGLLQSQGDYAGAKPLNERALAITETTLGAEHRSTKIIRGNLDKLRNR